MKLIETEEIPEIQAVSAWCRRIGRSHVTVWRWRENGWLTTINIAGRPYITRETILEFKRRAMAGEFAKAHHAPSAILLPVSCPRAKTRGLLLSRPDEVSRPVLLFRNRGALATRFLCLTPRTLNFQITRQVDCNNGIRTPQTVKRVRGVAKGPRGWRS